MLSFHCASLLPLRFEQFAQPPLGTELDLGRIVQIRTPGESGTHEDAPGATRRARSIPQHPRFSHSERNAPPWGGGGEPSRKTTRPDAPPVSCVVLRSPQPPRPRPGARWRARPRRGREPGQAEAQSLACRDLVGTAALGAAPPRDIRALHLIGFGGSNNWSSAISKATWPLAVTLAAKGASYLRRTLCIRGRAAMNARAIWSADKSPRPSMKQATPAATSASRSRWLRRIALSLVSTIQPRCPAWVSHSSSVVSGAKLSSCASTLRPSERRRVTNALRPSDRSTKKVNGSGSLTRLAPDRVLDLRHLEGVVLGQIQD